MKPYYQDNHIELYAKDCRQMTELADNSVQCVVTSPPYWGLRKYSGEQELIWGDNHCKHQWVEDIKPDDAGQGHYTGTTRWQHIAKEAQEQGIPVREVEPTAWAKGGFKSGFCSLCGAWKGAYGLEPTPEMYVQHTIEILREIRRVLRKDGVVFWNIGDTYATHASGSKKTGHNFRSAEVAAEQGIGTIKRLYGKNIGLKEKDLCLIPFRIAIACQEDGWWVRSVIIWSKPNPMPESVTDRPTESHEYILMLTKSARYYWDADAVREPLPESSIRRYEHAVKTNEQYDPNRHKHTEGVQSPMEVLTRSAANVLASGGRNIRSVWEFPTQPYPEAHFAVFPEKLPELCIKAATPEVGCCSKCGAPWERMVEENPEYRKLANTNKGWSKGDTELTKRMVKSHPSQLPNKNTTLGWQPTCKCNADKTPSIVLDPFAGAGTTLWVAKKLNRRAVGYEISQEYCALALERNRQQVLELT